jgi:hypothetical protein
MSALTKTGRQKCYPFSLNIRCNRVMLGNISNVQLHTARTIATVLQINTNHKQTICFDPCC